MGKGTIVSSMGGGRYSVRLERDMARMTAAMVKIETRLAALVLEIADTIWAVDDAKETYDASLVLLKAQIEAMKSSPTDEALVEATKEQTKAVLEKQRVWMAWKVALDKKYVEQTALQSKLATFQAVSTDPIVVTAWCADATEDITGTVGTAEIPGERGTVQVRPGYSTREVYNATRDGQLQPIESSTPAASYFNCAVFPGWQKWKPTYRHGTITAIDGDTCTVAMAAAASSAQGINVNASATLTNVPIEYMTCNGTVFAVGSEVLIQFTGQDYTKPKVIGFKENPSPCEFDVYCIQFEKKWFAPWLLSPAEIASTDMFFRRYFRLRTDGYLAFVPDATASKIASTKDIWSETPWRKWVYSEMPIDIDCEPQHKVATDRNVIGNGGAIEGSMANSQVVISLPGGINLSVAQTGVGITAWTSKNSKALSFLGDAYKPGSYGGGRTPYTLITYLPQLWFWYPQAFGGYPIQG